MDLGQSQGDFFTMGASEPPSPFLINEGYTNPPMQQQALCREATGSQVAATASPEQTQGFWYEQCRTIKPR